MLLLSFADLDELRSRSPPASAVFSRFLEELLPRNWLDLEYKLARDFAGEGNGNEDINLGLVVLGVDCASDTWIVPMGVSLISIDPSEL